MDYLSPDLDKSVNGHKKVLELGVQLLENGSKNKCCVNLCAECGLFLMLMEPWTLGWWYPGLKLRPGVSGSSHRPCLLFMSAVANDDER